MTLKFMEKSQGFCLLPENFCPVIEAFKIYLNKYMFRGRIIQRDWRSKTTCLGGSGGMESDHCHPTCAYPIVR